MHYAHKMHGHIYATGLPIYSQSPPPSSQDIQAHQSGELASFTSDTVEYDILRHGTEEVAVYNQCTDTTRHLNGIVTNMHPSEGVWLFRCASHATPC
jgi:hypothetical protein